MRAARLAPLAGLAALLLAGRLVLGCWQTDLAGVIAAGTGGGSQACGPGLTICDAGCVDTSASDDDCGACGTVCMGGSSCTEGACGCAGGDSYCSGACVDTKVSIQHCGVCGKECPPSKACVGGTCT